MTYRFVVCVNISVARTTPLEYETTIVHSAVQAGESSHVTVLSSLLAGRPDERNIRGGDCYLSNCLTVTLFISLNAGVEFL